MLYSPHSLSQKAATPTWLTQVADHPGPEPGLKAFLNFRGKREGEVFCFQRFAKALIGADSRDLKMRRLPPTDVPFDFRGHKVPCPEKSSNVLPMPYKGRSPRMEQESNLGGCS